MWPFKKRRKVIGHTTEFQSLKWYRKLLRGEITMEEWSKLTAEDLDHVVAPIYEDELEEGDVPNYK